MFGERESHLISHVNQDFVEETYAGQETTGLQYVDGYQNLMNGKLSTYLHLPLAWLVNFDY